MNNLSELEAKADACASAVMVLVGMLHERGAVAGADVAGAWTEHANGLADKQPDAAHWLAMLAGNLGRVSADWPTPGTARPW